MSTMHVCVHHFRERLLDTIATFITNLLPTLNEFINDKKNFYYFAGGSRIKILSVGASAYEAWSLFKRAFEAVRLTYHSTFLSFYRPR